MSPDELRAVADRAVASRHFRPMAGMRDLQGRTWTPDLLWRWNRTVDRPDLSDPATLGCLLALVREAWDDKTLFCWTDLDGAVIGQFRDNDGFIERGEWSPTEAEALVVALEAAP